MATVKVEVEKNKELVARGTLPEAPEGVRDVTNLVPVPIEVSFGKGFYANNVKVTVGVTRHVHPNCDDKEIAAAMTDALVSIRAAVRTVLPDLRKMLAGAMQDLTSGFQWDPLGDNLEPPVGRPKPPMEFAPPPPLSLGGIGPVPPDMPPV